MEEKKKCPPEASSESVFGFRGKKKGCTGGAERYDEAEYVSLERCGV